MHLFIVDDKPVLVWDRQGFVAAYLINAAHVATLTLECTSQLLGLDPLEPHFTDGQSPCMALLISFSLHPARTRTWRNGKALAYDPSFEDAAHNMECACLYDASADRL